MRRFLLPAVLPALCLAQTDLFEKAPPAVEEALRSRVAQFYQYHVDGKFRLAEDLVAEDSKDVFYNGNKQRCITYEIVRFTWSEEFSKAIAVVTCEKVVPIVGFSTRPLKVPETSQWRVENGEWFWFVPPRDGVYKTPFGPMKEGAGSGSGAIQVPDAEQIKAMLNGVRVDATEISLGQGEKASLSVHNGMKGEVEVLVQNSPNNVTAKLAPAKLQAGQDAQLNISVASDAPVGDGGLRLLVRPTGQIINIIVRPK